MCIKRLFPRLRRIAHHGAPLMIALAFVLSIGVSSIAFALPTMTTGDITGTVTNQNGVGLSGIKIDAYVLDSNMSSSNSVTWTASDGTYDLSGLPSGGYNVLFNNMPAATDPGAYYTHQWYNNESTGGGATPDQVSVSAGASTPNINATLAPAGGVSGRVVDEGGNGISGIKITAYASLSDYNNPGNPIDTAFVFTDNNGYYFMGGLPEGSSYIIDMNGPAAANYYLEQFYNNQSSVTTATPVNVSNDTTTPDINATLAPAGLISGRVTDENGNGVFNIKVEAYTSASDFDNGADSVGFTSTDSNGNYFLGGLPAGGSYVVLFDSNGNGNNPDPYRLQQFYDNQTSADSANQVMVTDGVTTSNINATLPTLGVISGTVNDTTGAPAQAYVSAYATANDFYNNTPSASASINSDGSYNLIDLSAGTYYVYFGPLPGYLYATQFYNNQPTIGTAATVTVSKGAATSNINATMTFLSATTGALEAHTNKLKPSCMGPAGHDSLPGICEAAFAGQTTTAKADVNVQNKRQGPTGGVTFTYDAAGHTMSVTTKSISSFYVFGTNNASAAIQGTATVTVDGVTTTNPFRVIATDGKLLNPEASDHFGIFIWAPGANPNTDQPLYYMNQPLTNGNVIVKL
jgi:hypothetical protein